MRDGNGVWNEERREDPRVKKSEQMRDFGQIGGTGIRFDTKIPLSDSCRPM